MASPIGTSAESALAVEVLVHLIDAGHDIGIRRRAHADPAGPDAVGKGAVPDIAARQGLRIAAQVVVHVVAVERRTGEIVLDIHSPDGNVQPVEQRLLGIGRDEMHRHVAAGAVDFLHRRDIVAEQVLSLSPERLTKMTWVERPVIPARRCQSISASKPTWFAEVAPCLMPPLTLPANSAVASSSR